MPGNNLSELSALQIKLLGDGLRAYYYQPVDIVCRSPDPGSFGVKASMATLEDRKMRACRRAAAGRAIARLIKRGLLECGSARGTWRLTKRGLKAAKAAVPSGSEAE
jgi:hypothetical protein